MLWEGYETARSLPMHMTALTSSEYIEPEKMAHRLGAMPAADEATARTRWLLEAPAGDVRWGVIIEPTLVCMMAMVDDSHCVAKALWNAILCQFRYELMRG